MNSEYNTTIQASYSYSYALHVQHAIPECLQCNCYYYKATHRYTDNNYYSYYNSRTQCQKISQAHCWVLSRVLSNIYHYSTTVIIFCHEYGRQEWLAHTWPSCIAGNFRGRDLLWISKWDHFVEKTFAEFLNLSWWVWHAQISWRKLSRVALILQNSWKFLPQKFSAIPYLLEVKCQCQTWVATVTKLKSTLNDGFWDLFPWFILIILSHIDLIRFYERLCEREMDTLNLQVIYIRLTETCTDKTN